MDQRDVDAERNAEHGRAGSTEVGVGFAGALEETLALAFEGEDARQEDDVLAVQLHARGVDLQAVVVARETGV